jgi:hypothetical protein
MGSPVTASMLAGTDPGHVGEACMTGTVKSLLVNVAVRSVNGPVTRPVRGMVRGPMVQDTPNNALVVPLTVASRVTLNPFGDDVQLNVPVIVDGSALNPIVGAMPGTRVSATDRGLNTWPSGGE